MRNWTTRTRTPGLAARLFTLLLAAAAPATVHAETTTVQAVGTGASAPIKSFEVSVETQAVRPAWLCQVVGPACIAGAIVVEADGANTNMTIRHALTGAELIMRFTASGALAVERGGIVVATFDPAVTYPGGGHANGFESLMPDPCWQLVRRAVSDSNLLAAVSPTETPTATACADACDDLYPLPASCDLPSTELSCCEARANREYCKRVCDCSSIAVDFEECELQARAARSARIASCILSSIGVD
jgi:hypothetical protein